MPGLITTEGKKGSNKGITSKVSRRWGGRIEGGPTLLKERGVEGESHGHREEEKKDEVKKNLGEGEKKTQGCVSGELLCRKGPNLLPGVRGGDRGRGIRSKARKKEGGTLGKS